MCSNPPTTPAIRPRTPTTTQRTFAQTPRRSSRTKFNDEEAERQNRLLTIAEKQVDTMRMLAENQIKLAEIKKSRRRPRLQCPGNRNNGKRVGSVCRSFQRTVRCNTKQ